MGASTKYQNGVAFRTALEEKLRTAATHRKVTISRLRTIVAFDRFLARLTRKNTNEWMLKGGYAMELRLVGARTTRDIDLSIRAFEALSPNNTNLPLLLLDRLQEAATLDIDDFFTFTVGATTGDVNAVYGGQQFPVTAELGGRVFEKFTVDVVIGDPPAAYTTKLPGTDLLEFADIPSESYPCITAEQHFAEKLHAYTFPRTDRVNSRVKDLVDLLLLIKFENLSTDYLVDAVHSTFQRRNTHKLPDDFPLPPGEWEGPYKTYAAECQINETILEAYGVIKDYLLPKFFS